VKEASQSFEANEMMKIEMLGTGCAKCKSLLMNAAKAFQELGIKIDKSQENAGKFHEFT
jgi:hypothetical protein